VPPFFDISLLQKVTDNYVSVFLIELSLFQSQAALVIRVFEGAITKIIF
jgi:hypothetical protein